MGRWSYYQYNTRGLLSCEDLQLCVYFLSAVSLGSLYILVSEIRELKRLSEGAELRLSILSSVSAEKYLLQRLGREKSLLSLLF